MSESNLSTLIKRLEAATQRLEEVAARGNVNGGGGNATNANTNTNTTNGSVVIPMLSAFDEVLQGPLNHFVELGKKIGDVVGEQSQIVHTALHHQKTLLSLLPTTQKPDGTTLASLVKPMQESVLGVTSLREKNRASRFYNHLSTVSEGIPALGWVVVEPAPGPFVGEMKESAMFWGNRVIKEWKDKDKIHVEWVNSFITLLNELQGYVKKYHTTGLSWNAKGGDAKASVPGGRGAPPPPPAPPVGIEPTLSSSSKPPTAALFSELNKGNLTSGLRKVPKSEMTHKNPELRGTSVVPSSSSTPTSSASTVTPKTKPPKFSLEGNKWIIENHINNNDLVIDKVELRHVVYVYNCVGCTVKIGGKVNAITIDNCKTLGLLLPSVVSTIDLVNSKSITVQITESAPTVVIDKTDGVQLYLAKTATDVEIMTAKSGGVNVLVEGEDGEFDERAVPEQLKTTIAKGKGLVSVAVEHKG